MLIDGYGYVYRQETIDRLKKKFENRKPSLLQKLVWLFWPTLTSLEWRRYKWIMLTEEGGDKVREN